MRVFVDSYIHVLNGTHGTKVFDEMIEKMKLGKGEFGRMEGMKNLEDEGLESDNGLLKGL